MWHKCPARFDFRYNKKLKEPKGAAATRGTDVHGKIESFLKGEIDMPPHVEFGGHLINDMKVRNFMSEIQFTMNEEWQPVPHGTGWITGFVDSYLLEKGVVEMGEWKTGGVYDNHEEQRNIYLTMALSCNPEAERAVINTIYLDKGQKAELRMARENLQIHQEHWSKKVEPIQADTFFSPRPGQHCKWCGFAKSKGGPCAHG
jgi:hypothetical protein